MSVHLEGIVEIPLSDFFAELLSALHAQDQFRGRGAIFVHPESLDFGGSGTRAEPGAFTGMIVQEGDLQKPLEEIDQASATRFHMGLELVWDLVVPGIAQGAAGPHEWAMGIPRLDMPNFSLFVPCVLNSENPRGTSFFTEALAPEWHGTRAVEPAASFMRCHHERSAAAHIKALREELDTNKQVIASLRAHLRLHELHHKGDFWHWAGDGSDNLASMSAGMAVVIAARDLRQLVDDGVPWISTNERLPEDGQTVSFVVDIPGDSPFGYLHGQVLGGTYRANPVTGGFGIPGAVLPASYWKPVSAPPAPVQAKGATAC